MPAGVPWPVYLKALAASMLAMFAGAEVVHSNGNEDDKKFTLETVTVKTVKITVAENEGLQMRPSSIPEIPPKPGELKTELLGLKERSSKVQTSQQ